MASGNYNYALNKSVAASSYILPYVPERAVNGTLSGPADRWTSAFWKFDDEKLFYKVDFGASYSISRYVIKSICDLPTGSSDKWPDNYENISVAVVYSTDNENWVDLDEYTSIENTIDRQFNSVKARYFMLTFPRGMLVNQNFVSIAQLEVYNTASQYLKSLTLSAGALSPSFSGTTQFNYTTVVEESVTRISLTPTAFSPSAIIQVNGQTVPSGTVSNSIPLSSDGHTAITVEVSDAGMSQLYTVLVSKNFSNSYIRSLTVNENDKNKSEVTLNPYFDGRYYFNYTASVEYDVLNSGSDTTQVTVTPTAEASNATIRVNNMLVPSGSSSSNIPLTIGAGNIIQVSCVPGQNALQMYTIAVTKASSPYLSGVTNMPINEPFKNTTLNYTATTSASSINVTPISEDPTAAITVKSGSTIQPVLSGKPVKLTFTSGQNIVTISISSTIGIDSRTYTFTVNKI